jgi:hypothetical protein
MQNAHEGNPVCGLDAHMLNVPVSYISVLSYPSRDDLLCQKWTIEIRNVAHLQA